MIGADQIGAAGVQDSRTPDELRAALAAAERRAEDYERLAASRRHVATCGCGTSYTWAAFTRLPLCGMQPTGDGDLPLELRHCACGSTVAGRS